MGIEKKLEITDDQKGIITGESLYFEIEKIKGKDFTQHSHSKEDYIDVLSEIMEKEEITNEVPQTIRDCIFECQKQYSKKKDIEMLQQIASGLEVFFSSHKRIEIGKSHIYISSSLIDLFHNTCGDYYSFKNKDIRGLKQDTATVLMSLLENEKINNNIRQFLLTINQEDITADALKTTIQNLDKIITKTKEAENLAAAAEASSAFDDDLKTEVEEKDTLTIKIQSFERDPDGNNQLRVQEVQIGPDLAKIIKEVTKSEFIEKQYSSRVFANTLTDIYQDQSVKKQIQPLNEQNKTLEDFTREVEHLNNCFSFTCYENDKKTIIQKIKKKIFGNDSDERKNENIKAKTTPKAITIEPEKMHKEEGEVTQNRLYPKLNIDKEESTAIAPKAPTVIKVIPGKYKIPVVPSADALTRARAEKEFREAQKPENQLTPTAPDSEEVVPSEAVVPSAPTINEIAPDILPAEEEVTTSLLHDVEANIAVQGNIHHNK